MRRQLVRSTFAAVLLSVLIMSLPLGAAGWWVMADHATRLRGWLDRPDLPPVPVRLLAVIAALSVMAVLVGVIVAWLQASRYAEPMAQLADRAERFSAGESRFQPLVTGIGEVDRIAEVLSRSALQMTRSLASERDFASDASHQLRTPLTALLMRLEEIGVTDDLAVVKEEAGIAIAQVERLTKVVDELLSRSRKGHVASPPSVSLDSVIAALQREWQPAFEQARRSVRVHGQRGLRVLATPVALSQVLSTLFENSLAHGRGTVDVHARRSGPSVVVEVSDQGEGVAAAIAPHIFERSVSTAKSSGLGLALARVDVLHEGIATEHKLAIGPEPEQGANADPDDVGDVVGQLGVQVEHVARETQTDDGDDHGDDVEEHEQREFVACLPVATAPEGPQPVAEPRHDGCHRRGDDPGREGLVVEHPGRVPLAEQPQQMRPEDEDVVAAQIDHERQGADHAELEHLAHEDVDRPASAVEQSRAVCRHGKSLASEAGTTSWVPRRVRGAGDPLLCRWRSPRR